MENKPPKRRRRFRHNHKHKTGFGEIALMLLILVYAPFAIMGLLLMVVSKLLILPAYGAVTGLLDYHFKEGDFAPKKNERKNRLDKI